MASYFQNKKILITGGASGIGKSMANLLAQENCSVIIWDINEDAGVKMLDESKNKAGKVFFYQVDLSHPEEMNACFEKTILEHGDIDILINNAGIVTGDDFIHCSEEAIRKTMEINATAVITLSHKFLKRMIERNSGHIVNIASAAGLVGVAKLADYAASKFAVVGFSESLRMELKKQKSKVSVTMVCPYYINTGMFDGVKTRFSFLLPILDQQKTAKQIIRAIGRQKPCLKLPATIHLLNWARLFPVPVFDFIVNVFGINQTMNEFKGRK